MNLVDCEGKTHGYWERRECYSASRVSVGGEGNRPKRPGTCRGKPLN